jgi:hypothetical protein
MRRVCNYPDIEIALTSSCYHKLSDDPYLANKYHKDPGACDLSEFMVVPNLISGCDDIIFLFKENKLGVDVDVCISGLQSMRYF